MLNMSKLFQKIKENPDMVIYKFSKTDEYDNLLEDRNKIIVFEYKDKIFKIFQDYKETKISCYFKVNPFKMIQQGYSCFVKKISEINKYIKLMITEQSNDNLFQDDIIPELSITYGGKSVLYMLQNEISGNLEKEVLNHLKHIEMVRNSGGYKLLRFWHYNGKDWFDFELNSLRITG